MVPRTLRTSFRDAPNRRICRRWSFFVRGKKIRVCFDDRSAQINEGCHRSLRFERSRTPTAIGSLHRKESVAFDTAASTNFQGFVEEESKSVRSGSAAFRLKVLVGKPRAEPAVTRGIPDAGTGGRKDCGAGEAGDAIQSPAMGGAGRRQPSRRLRDVQPKRSAGSSRLVGRRLRRGAAFR